MKKNIALLVAVAVGVSACATSSGDIAASYVSPMQYQPYDCAQIASELQRVQSRSAQLAGRLDEAAANDKVLTGVGAVLFWPALFALGGTKQQEAEYARLKGEHDALTQASIARRCPGAMPAAPLSEAR